MNQSTDLVNLVANFGDSSRSAMSMDEILKNLNIVFSALGETKVILEIHHHGMIPRFSSNKFLAALSPLLYYLKRHER